MSSRTGHRECPPHNTPRHLIEPFILGEIRSVTALAREREVEFIALIERAHERIADSELRSAKIELEKAKQRITELDVIIKKMYEDNATGRISNVLFDKFFADYDAEQARLTVRTAKLTELIAAESEKNASASRFLGLVKKYTDVPEFTAEIVRVFIDRIVVHQANGRWGKNRRQRIDTYYNFIGVIEQ